MYINKKTHLKRRAFRFGMFKTHFVLPKRTFRFGDYTIAKRELLIVLDLKVDDAAKLIES